MATIRSAWIWLLLGALIVAWLPILAVVRLFDRDPALYRTGYTFRLLGRLMTRVNPAWRVSVDGYTLSDPRRPYVVVANHQSLADIPVISLLSWEMKWVAKKELFEIPLVGWMMRLAGDIALEREDRRSGARALIKARAYLQDRCSVMFFPEGTRSRDGRVGAFTDGAFLLAMRAGVAILPLAVDGTHGALPKDDWKFGSVSEVRLRVLEPIDPAEYAAMDAASLQERVRAQIIDTIASWRGVDALSVDAIARPVSGAPPPHSSASTR